MAGTSLTLARDFNAGTLAEGILTSPPFLWNTGGTGSTHEIQVAIKDFTTGETATKTVPYQVSPLVTGCSPVVVATANPLVALFSTPPCAPGSTMRVAFQPKSMLAPATATNWKPCHASGTMTFEIAGMYPTNLPDVRADRYCRPDRERAGGEFYHRGASE